MINPNQSQLNQKTCLPNYQTYLLECISSKSCLIPRDKNLHTGKGRAYPPRGATVLAARPLRPLGTPSPHPRHPTGLARPARPRSLPITPVLAPLHPIVAQIYSPHASRPSLLYSAINICTRFSAVLFSSSTVLSLPLHPSSVSKRIS